MDVWEVFVSKYMSFGFSQRDDVQECTLTRAKQATVSLLRERKRSSCNVLTTEGSPLYASDTHADHICCAGITSTVAMFPLETARTRLAVNSKQYSNMFQCLSSIAKQEGLGAWYKVRNHIQIK